MRVATPGAPPWRAVLACANDAPANGAFDIHRPSSGATGSTHGIGSTFVKVRSTMPLACVPSTNDAARTVHVLSMRIGPSARVLVGLGSLPSIVNVVVAERLPLSTRTSSACTKCSLSASMRGSRTTSGRPSISTATTVANGCGSVSSTTQPSSFGGNIENTNGAASPRPPSTRTERIALVSPGNRSSTRAFCVSNTCK